MPARKTILAIAIAAVILIGISLSLPLRRGEKEFHLTPKQKLKRENRGYISTEVGTGWSINTNPEDAVREAANAALRGKSDRTPDFAVIFADKGSDMAAILAEARVLFGSKTSIYGGTSDSRGVMTDRGLIQTFEKNMSNIGPGTSVPGKMTAESGNHSSIKGNRSLGLMTVTSKDVIFGVGSADYRDYLSIREASKAAVYKAMANAGKSVNEMPTAILTTHFYGNEEEFIEGIEEIVGRDTPLLGGGAYCQVSGVSGEDKVYKKGISLALIYTDLPVGWIFEGGFDVRDPYTGVITKTQGQMILEIDNRPALDVYDEWFDGQVMALLEEGKSDALRYLRVLNPICKRFMSPGKQTYYLFVAVGPVVDTRSLKVNFRVEEGERIYLSHGTWETLLNRIANLPRNAKTVGGIGVEMEMILGIGYVCTGVIGVIPEAERERIPLLMKYANGGAPFIVSFTGGEQGHFPGIGNKHGHLLTSFLVIGNRDENE